MDTRPKVTGGGGDELLKKVNTSPQEYNGSGKNKFNPEF